MVFDLLYIWLKAEFLTKSMNFIKMPQSVFWQIDFVDDEFRFRSFASVFIVNFVHEWRYLIIWLILYFISSIMINFERFFKNGAIFIRIFFFRFIFIVSFNFSLFFFFRFLSYTFIMTFSRYFWENSWLSISEKDFRFSLFEKNSRFSLFEKDFCSSLFEKPVNIFSDASMIYSFF